MLPFLALRYLHPPFVLPSPLPHALFLLLIETTQYIRKWFGKTDLKILISNCKVRFKVTWDDDSSFFWTLSSAKISACPFPRNIFVIKDIGRGLSEIAYSGFKFRCCFLSTPWKVYMSSTFSKALSVSGGKSKYFSHICWYISARGIWASSPV